MKARALHGEAVQLQMRILSRLIGNKRKWKSSPPSKMAGVLDLDFMVLQTAIMKVGPCSKIV